MKKNTLSHLTDQGKARMVDVSNKPQQVRTAIATGHIALSPETLELVRENRMKKGDVLAIAEFAGIQGGKKTSELIPLCHPLMISKIEVTAVIDSSGIRIDAEAKCTGQTGIEMEALVGASIAAITIYDMCKAMSHDIVIKETKLMKKTGGKNDFERA